MWQAYLFDVRTGLLAQPIDLPAFTWQMTITESSFSTTKDKSVGEDEISGLELPWSQIPGTTPSAKANALMCGKRGIVLFWKTLHDEPTSLGTPVIAGVLGMRTSRRLDVSVPVDSIMSILAQRFLVHEGQTGTGAGHTSQGEWHLKGSWRGIASEVGWQCTNGKPGGELPIDWTYRGESGNNTLEVHDWDLQNNSCKTLLDKIAGLDHGPDMQLRPYLTEDGQHIRFRFLAGSDGDRFLGQSVVHSLASHPYGGTLEDIKVDRCAPVHRVYATGSGSDKATITAIGQDLTLVHSRDPWALLETVVSDTDAKDANTVQSTANSHLNANRVPLMQISGSIDAADTDPSGMPLHPLGSLWAGEHVDVAIDGFPDLPDGVYRLRLMRMSGDETSKVNVLFDVEEDPLY